MIRQFLIILALAASLKNAAQTVTPEKPVLPASRFSMDSIPESELNIPIRVDLKPFFAMAGKQVDTLFTSPGYPNKWVQDGCDTRYKYSFRRSPLQFSFQNNKLTIAFTGYYRIIGSTRGCLNGTPITPWTPDCRCGFEDGERRVNVTYTITPVVLVNYVVRLQVVRNEPVPIDRCSVCFWEHDITSTIMSALKKELDLSKADLEKTYGRIDLKPQFQRIWNMLNTPYNLNNMGWLQINPQKVRLNQLYGTGDKLNINIGLAAKPVVKFEKPVNPLSPIPNIRNYSTTPGFNINIDAVMDYDSLSAILSKQIAGREFIFQKAFVKKKFIFQECELMGGKSDRLVIRVKFTGTDNGYFYVTGKPVYNDATKTLAAENIDFDVKSKDALLKTADWLFSKKITSEIEKMAKYDLTSLMNDTKNTIQQQLNREFMKGIRGVGNITDMGIAGIYPEERWLIVRANTKGSFSLNVSGIDLSL